MTSYLIVWDVVEMFYSDIDDFLRNKYLYLKVPDHAISDALSLALLNVEYTLRAIDNLNQYEFFID